MKADPTNDRDFLNHLTFEPLNPGNWEHFTKLFGEKGACGNCWCMWYRLKKAEFVAGKKNNGNRDAMHHLVQQGVPVGILGIYQGQAIAWCAFAPREHYSRIENSRIHKRIDDQPVWSIPCFFVDKKFRGRGVSAALLEGVIRYARENGIGIIEAYPTIPTQERLPDSFAWIGLYQAFEKAGFRIVDHRSKSRPMVRYFVK